MQTTARTLTLLLAICCALPGAAADGFLKVGDQRRSEVRDAVAAHRAVRREEVRREEAAAGRRLTAEERAELREQLRRQWIAMSEAAHAAEAQPAEREAPTTAATPVVDARPASSRTLPPAARSQRP